LEKGKREGKEKITRFAIEGKRDQNSERAEKGFSSFIQKKWTRSKRTRSVERLIKKNRRVERALRGGSSARTQV